MSIEKKKIKKLFGITAATIGTAFIGLKVIAKAKKGSSVYRDDPEQQNAFTGKKVVFVEDSNDAENADGIRGHLEVTGVSDYKQGIYDKYIKRAIDVVLSFGGLLLLSPVFAGISLAIIIDDPGPVLFTQKRVGRNKEYFKLHKFRSMKMCTPHDTPTHMLENPEQYITRVGKFLRAHSLDELPQIWDIFVGNMSVIGPRPALWNQDVLTAERDKYGANDVKPGLTGWAQINGRDELEIPEKAKLDGEYVKKESLAFDMKCFLGTVGKVAKDDSVVEGGTGGMKKTGRHYTEGKADEELIGQIGFEKPVQIDLTASKKVLITGAGSYIGETFRSYAENHYGNNFCIDAVDMINPSWKEMDFSAYDIVYHVAGIAHADVGNVSEEVKENYYKVNTDLAVQVCEKAKAEGVKEFIFMSSMIVYGESAPYGKKKVVDEHTVPAPANFYGDSKLQADVAVRELADDNFKVIVLRPPMIYGRGSKGNYPTLAKLAKKLPIFPNVNNERSMLYIENLCEFLCQIMLIEKFEEASVVLIPQNKEWTRTSDMVQQISMISGKKSHLLNWMNPIVAIGGKMPGKIGGLVNKAFGNSCYSHSISDYKGMDYQKISMQESVFRTEGNAKEPSDKEDHIKSNHKKHILVVSQYFYPETFRINDMCQEWVKRGYQVTVLTGIPNYPMGKFFDGYSYTKRRRENWNGVEIIRIPLIPRGHSSLGMIANYASFVVSGFIKNLLSNIKADLVFTFEVSPMTQALIGCWYAKKHHVPHYLYVQDLWPENVVTVTGISNPAIIKPIDKMVDYIYKNTDEIFATSPSFVEAICNRNVKVPKEKVHYWPQYAEEFYQPCERKPVQEIPDDGSFKVIFTGNIGTAQGLQILPQTAELLKNENVKFVMVGDGRYLDEFNREVKERNVEDKFIMVPRQPAERIPELLSACDVAFLSFQDDPLWTMTIPAKLQSYMACGMPIIAAAGGETRRIVEEAACGICSNIGNVEQVAKGIKSLMNVELIPMQKNSRKYYEQYFDKKQLMNLMDNYFEAKEKRE